ncbi:MAG: hypothetical protein V1766_01540 [Pseudomonadota bacterium]
MPDVSAPDARDSKDGGADGAEDSGAHGLQGFFMHIRILCTNGAFGNNHAITGIRSAVRFLSNLMNDLFLPCTTAGSLYNIRLHFVTGNYHHKR